MVFHPSPARVRLGEASAFYRRAEEVLVSKTHEVVLVFNLAPWAEVLRTLVRRWPRVPRAGGIWVFFGREVFGWIEVRLGAGVSCTARLARDGLVGGSVGGGFVI